MLTQFFIGSCLTLASFLVATLSWWILEVFLARLHEWSLRPPHGLKLMVVLTAALVWTLFIMSIAVWLWALALYTLDIFVELEASVYFALVAFTTLGFGDILLPQE